MHRLLRSRINVVVRAREKRRAVERRVEHALSVDVGRLGLEASEDAVPDLCGLRAHGVKAPARDLGQIGDGIFAVDKAGCHPRRKHVAAPRGGETNAAP